MLIDEAERPGLLQPAQTHVTAGLHGATMNQYDRGVTSPSRTVDSHVFLRQGAGRGVIIANIIIMSLFL